MRGEGGGGGGHQFHQTGGGGLTTCSPEWPEEGLVLGCVWREGGSESWGRQRVECVGMARAEGWVLGREGVGGGGGGAV